MSDVTLSADTLWSEIKGTADTDGDTVDLNGYALTFDESVIPRIYFVNDGYVEGAKWLADNQTNTIWIFYIFFE